MSRRLVRTLLAGSLLALIAAPALAHADLETAMPGPGETLTDPPEELVATFTENLDVSRSSLAVRDGAGVIMARGGTPGGGPRELRLGLPELTPGEYEVGWASWSTEDNEGHRGTYTFTVVAPPSPTASATLAPTATPGATPSASSTHPPSPSATPTPGPPGSADESSTIVPILAAVAVVGGLGFWLLRRRSP